MSYSKKIKGKVFELLTDELSPEKIEDILTKDPIWRKEDIPTARTIRNWKNKNIDNKEYESISNKDVIQHDREVFKKCTAPLLVKP